MAQKVSVEVRTITKRDGANGPFWSLNIADSGAEGYSRLPEAQFRSYSISNEEGWKKFQSAIEKALKAFDPTAKLNEKKDANKATFWSTKPMSDKQAPAVVIVDIELAEGYDLKPEYDPKLKAMVLKLSGKLLTSTVRVRGKRPGNSVE